ncbi:MAG: ImmA/IrrE family metallo-endopeptidase [Clostridia bacterium]
MIVSRDEAEKKANLLVSKFETRDPYKLADALGITILENNFKKQKGVYKVIEKNRFIFIKQDLDPVMKSIVLLHEIGHDQLHRTQAIKAGGFQEFNIFEMRNIRMEYEANIFAASVSLEDSEVLELAYDGYDIAQIAKALNSDINLLALKLANLKTKGHDFRGHDFDARFLR